MTSEDVRLPLEAKAWGEQYHAGMSQKEAAAFKRGHAAGWRDALEASAVSTPPTITASPFPAHWSLDDKLRDLHARYHCQDGNLLGKDECAWFGCSFWEHAEFAIVAALHLGGETNGK